MIQDSCTYIILSDSPLRGTQTPELVIYGKGKLLNSVANLDKALGQLRTERNCQTPSFFTSKTRRTCPQLDTEATTF